MGHRHRRKHSQINSNRSAHHSRRCSRNFRPGGRRWYRIPSQGHLAGICAGMADYYDVSPLMARGLTITAGLFMPQVVVIAYIVGIFALPTRSEAQQAQREKEQTILDELEERELRRERRQREFQRAYETITDIGDEPSEPTLDSKRIIIRRFKERMGGLEGRLQNLEQHVTSRRYDLAREIDSL